MSPTGGKLDSMAASSVTEPPNMRDQICHGHGRAAILAMQEDFVSSAMSEGPATFTTGRGGPPIMTAAMAAPPPAGPIADEKVAFDPIPVFVGPKPGWTGPVLAARGGDAKDSAVTAFAAEKESTSDSVGAPAVLRSAVKPAARFRRAHLTPEGRARLVAATQRVVAKKNQAH